MPVAIPRHWGHVSYQVSISIQTFLCNLHTYTTTNAQSPGILITIILICCSLRCGEINRPRLTLDSYLHLTSRHSIFICNWPGYLMCRGHTAMTQSSQNSFISITQWLHSMNYPLKDKTRVMHQLLLCACVNRASSPFCLWNLLVNLSQLLPLALLFVSYNLIGCTLNVQFSLIQKCCCCR